MNGIFCGVVLRMRNDVFLCNSIKNIKFVGRLFGFLLIIQQKVDYSPNFLNLY